MAEALPTIDPADWDGVPMPHRAWWLRDLIPSRHVTFLAGEDGVGKSHLALQWSVASALGVGTVCGVPMDGRVLYLGRDEPDAFQRRLARLVEHHGHGLADLRGRFLLIPMDDHEPTFARPVEDDAKTRTPVWRQFMEACLEFQPDLIVIDNDAEMFGGEQDPRQTRHFLGLLRRLAFERECAVLLLSHSDAAHAASWSNSARSSLRLDFPAGYDVDPSARVLRIEKSNYAASGTSFALRLDDGAFVAA